MSLRVNAKLVAEGIGLPPMWMDAKSTWWEEGEWLEWGVMLKDINIDPTAPQTAFGLAMKLDEWGSTTDDTRWVLRLAYALVGSPQWDEAVGEMIVRVERVGVDAVIRRALWPDVEVEPGTLAKFWHHQGLGVWMMQHESIPKPEQWDGWGKWDGGWSFPGVATDGLLAETAVPGIHAGPPNARKLRTPDEALRVIYKTVCK